MTRVANVLFADARTIPALDLLPAVERVTAAQGGLWVGGRVTLTREWLDFHPNAMNRAVHVGTLDRRILVAEIEFVEVRPGFAMKTITVVAPRQVMRIRCYRAQAFAERIRSLGPEEKSRHGS